MSKIVVAVIIFCLPISCISKKERRNTEADKQFIITEGSENNIVRLSKITIKPEFLEVYNDYLKEEIETSMKTEPGVLTLYAVAEKNNPNKIVILEIYHDEDAYNKHIKTPHFLKYKEGTIEMVQELELIDTNPILPGLKIK